MLPIETIIIQFNRHHENAMRLANGAVDSAKAAGQLLLLAKKVTPHGCWIKLLETDLNVSPRQAQRYMAIAQGKAAPLRELTGKNDTVSYLEDSNRSSGIWKNGKWRPEAGCMYLFKEDGASYWVQPSTESGLWFHVCKHYSGEKMSTDGFKRQWTIFGKVTDPDLTSQFYVGTTRPLGYIGVEGVLTSYGLKNLKDTLQLGTKTDQSFEGPFGEPSSDNWYWGVNGEWDDREAYVDSLTKSNSA